ncbi:hypothetical protein ACROYT_G013983 [Oculina patagonica]
MSLQTKESESSSCSFMTSVEEHQESSGPDTSSRKLRVTFLASEWGSSKGGLSTVNRELAINVAKDPAVHVTIFVPQCNDEDIKAALSHRIDLVKAKRRPGYDELEWLSFPPDDLQIDVVVGHGVKLGHQAQVIRESHNCKWVQVVHTAPEELGMYKTYSNPVSVNEKKHETEVELCEMADFVVTVGPKLSEAFRSYLRGCKKDQMVFEFTPGLFAEFSDVKQVVDERKKFKVLVFGRGDEEDFELKGFDIAAKAAATLDDTHLVSVGASDGKQDEVKNRLLECGISADNLTVRSFLKRREKVKKLLSEVDLAVMPSRTEGFGLTGLEALSAGLPILVSRNSGFGEALRKVLFGSFFVIDSEDPEVWAKAIKDVWNKDRRRRLQESESLRASYEKEYSWQSQTKSLIDRMVSMTRDKSSTPSDASVSCLNSSRRTVQTRQTAVTSERQSGTLPIVITMDSVTYQKAKSGDAVQQEEAKRLIMNEMVQHFLQTHAADVPVDNIPLCLHYYLKGGLDLIVREAIEGSLRLTVECSTLEILERLWKDYCSGHFNAVAEERLLTDDIKTKFKVECVKLKTTILEDDYLACKLVLMRISQVNQNNEPLPQDQIQAADETQTQTADEPEPMTVHLAVNYRDGFENTQKGNRTQQLLVSEGERSVLEEVTSDEEELPEYFQHLKVIRDSTTREESENSLRIAVECQNLESLERLWEDYRSGRLNAIAEKGLVTEDIKSRFHVKSVNLTTTIQEEDYLALKEFLTNKPQSNHGSSIMASKQITPQGTEETLIQSSEEAQTQTTEENGIQKTQIQPPEETQTRGTDKSVTMTTQETVIQSAEETQTQAVHGSETLTAGNAYIPSAEETQTQCVEDSKTQATVETHIPSHEEIHTQVIDESTNWPKEEIVLQSGKEIWMHSTEDMESLATDQTKIPTAEETRTQAAEILATEDTQIKNPEETRTQMEESESESESETESENESKTVTLEAKKSFDPTLDTETLKINTTLTRLDLRGKQIDDNGARSLSEVLKVNASLTNLDVSENKIGHRGAKSIFEALEHNATLTSLNASKNNIGVVGACSLSSALKHNATLTNLNVSQNNIGPSGAVSLSSALEHNATLTNLDVSQNNINPSGADSLSSALEQNTTLTNLDMSKNNIGPSGADSLSSALKQNATLTNLNVSQNNIYPSGADSLSSALEQNTTLTNLDMSKNNIGPSGADSLSSALKQNATLTNLNVSQNNINPSGADSLSSALEQNATLTYLDMSKNNIGPSGADSLSSALKQNATLTNLNVSQNNINPSGADSLSSALEQNATLTNLNVSNNDIGLSGAYSLSSALKQNATLTNLNVSQNNIGPSGAHSLSSALKQNATLTNLNVSQNNIGASGAYSLSSALEHNATLTNLDMSKNNIGPSGAGSLSSALKYNATLTYLNVSKNNIGKRGADNLSKILQHNTTLTVLDVSENADLEERSISDILKARTTTRKREIADVGAAGMKDVWGELGAFLITFNRASKTKLRTSEVKFSILNCNSSQLFNRNRFQEKQMSVQEKSRTSILSVPRLSRSRPRKITRLEEEMKERYKQPLQSMTSISSGPEISRPRGITSLEKETEEAGIKIVGDDNSDPT